MRYVIHRLWVYSMFFCLMSVLVFKSGALAYRPFATEDAGVCCRGDMYVETSWERMAEPDIHSDTFLLVYVDNPQIL